MSYDPRSLLAFLDSPVVVGDPEGRAVYANPAFLESFAERPDPITGRPLSEFFEGGGRESVLAAVAEVCSGGRTIRFRVRQGDIGYAGLASPITADGSQVGVLILLTEEAVGEERLLAFHREIQGPLDEVEHCLMAILEQTGGRRSEQYRLLLEEGLRAHARLRKWSEQLHALLSGFEATPATELSLDPVQTVRAAVADLRVDPDASGVRVELLLPARLPRAKGDPDRFGDALVGLLRECIAHAPYGAAYTIAARAVGSGSGSRVLISIVEPAGAAAGTAVKDRAEALRETVAASGGSLVTTEDERVGRTTAIQLPVAS
ncbi:MAG: PAS domain-containing protein [Deltaproteobacteria bacterium]|nr:MAG: PAS domain-containing protein [Deltaproteobacteria bacterium]